jgi:hypothetical protein
MAKLFGTRLENKISDWLYENKIRAKDQARFMGKHSTIPCILTFKIIFENCCSNKEYHFSCCFVDFGKSFDILHMGNILNYIED